MTTDGFDSLQPAFTTFKAGYDAGQPQLLYRRFVGDLETPLSAYLKLTGNAKGSFLLESVEGGEQLGRYSTIGIDPDLIWQCKDGYSKLLTSKGVLLQEGDDALSALRELVTSAQVTMPASVERELPPMASGLFGYFAYDFIRYVEHLPDRPEDHLQLPDAYLVRPQVMATFDSVKREVVLVTTARPEIGLSSEAAYDDADSRLNTLIDRVRQPLDVPVS
ncbi:MAG: anthranilate synthase component I, partial [Pseudomonadota bacterium]